jgi:hypothetical protein
MTFDTVANRSSFQSGLAILWSFLALGIWACVIYAYNHRRINILGNLLIVPKVNVRGIFLHRFEDIQDVVVRSDNSLNYSSDVHFVAVVNTKKESRLTDYMSKEQAQELVNEINKNR